MKYFKLPDLGEGLPEAEIVEWHVKAGETVKEDQLLVSVETDKAIVEVPSPQSGVIAHLFGNAGDILHTGEALVEYLGEEQEDTGTVVGVVKTDSHAAINDDHFIIGNVSNHSQNQSQPSRHYPNHRCTAPVRALAKRLNIDLSNVTASGPLGLITVADVEKFNVLQAEIGVQKPLSGARRSMAKNLAKAEQEVVKITLSDDADLYRWPKKGDPTLRLIRAISQACQKEANLNAWYDGPSMTLRPLQSIDIGIAVDTPEGLFVPILRNVANRNLEELKQGLTRLREDVNQRTVPVTELQGASITLSNFGTIAGRYGNPVVVPPTVAILGAGAIREQVVAHQGEVAIHRVMPLSLSFDHRPITGGEAARFLRAVIDDLELTE
ncbi:MAG: branched-chain alpha-keto acid dehydrogenase subunit E2 [Gammaproteobacteria bacterium]|nr:MAG: branched-chain alpha-keto acid dehydrogenase subunit E2 [Gammaproteobacteria bacterium]